VDRNLFTGMSTSAHRPIRDETERATGSSTVSSPSVGTELSYLGSFWGNQFGLTARIQRFGG
jgi:hypothetical protein